ncbi:MAG: hypothetical protein ACOCYT_05600 [Chloroflexota bacterium]
MSTNPKGDVQRIEITGQYFNEGVLAALRAYPAVQTVRRVVVDGRETLLLEVMRHKSGVVQVDPLIRAVISAGGKVTTIRRLDNGHQKADYEARHG